MHSVPNSYALKFAIILIRNHWKEIAHYFCPFYMQTSNNELFGKSETLIIGALHFDVRSLMIILVPIRPRGTGTTSKEN